jgi:hypothetical protein
VQELEDLVADLNRQIPEAQPRLRLPDLKFRRRIGRYAHQPYGVDGTLLAPDAYATHLAQVLPGVDDLASMDALFQDPNWIEPRAVTR